MTELRQRMLEELQRRNFAPSTIRYYIRTVRDFAAYFKKPPDQLGAEQLRQFQLHMLRDQKLATGTVENRMTALHFSSTASAWSFMSMKARTPAIGNCHSRRSFWKRYGHTGELAR